MQVFITRRLRNPRRQKLGFNPQQPANIAWVPPLRPNVQRKLQTPPSHKPGRLYPGVPPVAPPPVGAAGSGRTQVVYYVSRRPKFPPRRKVYPFAPSAPPPVGVAGSGGSKFFAYIARTLLNRALMARQHRLHGLWVDSGSTPPPPGNTTDYILRARRRGRR